MDPIMKSRDPVGRRGALSEAARLLPYAKAYRGLFLLTFLRNASTGRIMLRFMGDINAILDMITDGFLRAVMDSVTILVVVVVILSLNWQLAVVVLSALPVYALTFVKINPALRNAGRAA